MLLSEMDLEFSYIEGAKNHLADSLSRAVDFPPSTFTAEETVGHPYSRTMEPSEVSTPAQEEPTLQPIVVCDP